MLAECPDCGKKVDNLIQHFLTCPKQPKKKSIPPKKNIPTPPTPKQPAPPTNLKPGPKPKQTSCGHPNHYAKNLCHKCYMRNYRSTTLHPPNTPSL